VFPATEQSCCHLQELYPIAVLVDANWLRCVREIRFQHRSQYGHFDLLIQFAVRGLKGIIAIPVVTNLNQHVDNPGGRSDINLGMLREDICKKG
jgi:hypothetical protein